MAGRGRNEKTEGGSLSEPFGSVLFRELASAAASAEASGSTLVALNGRHYPMLESVLVPYRKS